MTTTIASATTPGIDYTITVEHGKSISCTCLGNFYGKTCRHMKSTDADIKAEIARAARFLAARLQVQGMQETWKANREMAFDSRF
jgi:hypothetical protein